MVTWNFSQDWPAVQYPTTVPALAEEALASICPLDPAEPAACLQLAQSAPATLSGPPAAELELPALVFPLPPSDASTGVADPTRTKPDAEEMTSPDSPTGNDAEQAALLAYAETIARLGDRITASGEEFGDIALAFRAGDLTLAEFEARFSSFASTIRALIVEAETLSPPETAAAIHRELTNGLDKCNQGLDYMEEWFDNPNSETKETTALLVAECINEVSRTAAELESLVQAGPAAP